MRSVRFIGPGRAGCSLSSALGGAGWDVVGLLGRGDDLAAAASGSTCWSSPPPTTPCAEVAAAVDPVPTTVVVHLSGSLGLDVLAPHPRRAALHPLVPLPNAEVGARRLTGGVTFAVAGDPVARRMAESLGGRAVVVADADRAAVPRGRLHRRQPRGGPARPGRAGGRRRRPPPRRLLGPDPGGGGRRGPARAPPRPHRSGRPGRLGDAGPPPARPWPPRSARATTPGSAWPCRLAADRPEAQPAVPAVAEVRDDDAVDDVPEVRVPGDVVVGAAPVGVG